MNRNFEWILPGALLFVLVLVGVTSRNPNVIVAVAIIAVVVFLLVAVRSLVRLSWRRAWARAQQQARWEASSSDTSEGTLIVVQRVARLGERTEALGSPQQIALLPPAGPDDEGQWDVRFAEAFGRAENRAITRNAELEKRSVR